MKTNKLKLTQYISAFFILLLSPDLLAQSIAMVPGESWLSKFNTSVNQTPNLFSQATSFNYLNGQVVSNQVNFGGQFAILSMKPDAQGLFTLDVRLDSAQAVAKDLQIHVTTEQDLGFGSATIHLDATCAAVLVNIPATQGIAVQIDRNFQVQGIQTNFDKLSLTTTLQNCTDIGGLQEEIQTRIVAVMKSQLFETQLKQILTTEINNQINLKVKSIVSQFVENKSSDVPVKISVDAQNKLWIYVGTAVETLFAASEIDQLGLSPKPSAIIKKLALETSLLKNLNAQLAMNPVLSKGNSSLEHLTCSRWVQFFVWPALKAFPKCFQMQFISEIKELKLTDLSKLSFSVKANNWAQAVEPARNIAYFDLQSEISLKPAQVKINSIKGQHDPEFLKWSGRSSRISTSLVTSTLQTYLQQQLDILIKGNQLLNPQNINNIKLLNADTLLVQLQ